MNSYVDALVTAPDVTVIRRGNYVFYDAMQVGLAIVPLDHCALRVLATVVSVARRYL